MECINNFDHREITYFVDNNYIVGLSLIHVMVGVLGPGEGEGGWKEGEDVGETEGTDICH